MKNRITTLAFTFLVLAGAPVGGQIDTEMVPPERDLGDLFQRVRESRFVVVGTVQASEGVSKRPTPELLEKMKTSLDEAFGGSLFTVRVDRTLCRQSDFNPAAPGEGQTRPDPIPTLQIFVPRDEPLWVGGYKKEVLLKGERVMLYLAEPSIDKRQEWVRLYQLDPRHNYYRSQSRSRGVVRLPKSASPWRAPLKPPVLDKVLRLCNAVRPTSMASKIANLERLATSGDEVLEKEAKLAVESLRKSH
jgi:hypothetical protein